MAVFRRQSAGVEKDQDDDEPVERLRLDDSSTELTTSAVDTVKPATISQQHAHTLTLYSAKIVPHRIK